MILEPTYEVICAADAHEGLDQFRREPPNLILLDVILPDSDGLTLLQTVRAEDPHIPVIMLTHEDGQTAVDAMKMARRLCDETVRLEELRLIVPKAWRRRISNAEVRACARRSSAGTRSTNLIGKSPPCRRSTPRSSRNADAPNDRAHHR